MIISDSILLRKAWLGSELGVIITISYVPPSCSQAWFLFLNLKLIVQYSNIELLNTNMSLG